MENNNEEALTPEEIAQMDALFGFGGCNCSNCGHNCGEEPGDFEGEE